MNECSFSHRRELPCGEQTPVSIQNWATALRVGDEVAIRCITEDCRINYAVSVIDGVTGRGLLVVRDYGMFDKRGRASGEDARRFAMVRPTRTVHRAITNKMLFALKKAA